MQHTREISKYVRISGSSDEAHALNYVKKTLTSYGALIREYSFNSLIGYPEFAELSVPASGQRFPATAPALSTSTPEEGLPSEVVFIAKNDEFGKINVDGKVVLLDGYSSPGQTRLAEQHGALGQIFINDEWLHEGIVSTVWGTATPETAQYLPKTPSISITAAAGKHLLDLLKKGRVEVLLKTKVWRGWKKIPIVTAEFSEKSGEDFVLFGGHIESWHYGAMDNATGNAVMIEAFRILSKHVNELKRNLRLGFWSGHSHGRFSGSTWYVDNFWEELYRHCVAYVDIDLPGAVGATKVSGAGSMVEARKLLESAVRSVTGEGGGWRMRMSRADDMSFWGIGLSSILVHSKQGVRDPRVKASTLMGPDVVNPFWWHAKEDTFDKIDANNLTRDAKVYTSVVSELCLDPVVPFDYSLALAEIEDRLRQYHTQGGSHFDLNSLVKRCSDLKDMVTKFNSKVQTLPRTDLDKIKLANETIKELGRLLVPVNYSSSGSFDQDLAIPIPAVPLLRDMEKLPKTNPRSDEYGFLLTRLKRNSNNINFAFLQAEKSLTQALNTL
jgi:hypothetical protein